MTKTHLILSICLLLMAEHSWASNAVGTVGEIWASPTSNLIMFSIPDSDSKLHRCNTSGRFSINLSRPGGHVTYELLMYAKQNGYTLSVNTLNTCNVFDAENVKNITVKWSWKPQSKHASLHNSLIYLRIPEKSSSPIRWLHFFWIPYPYQFVAQLFRVQLGFPGWLAFCQQGI